MSIRTSLLCKCIICGIGFVTGSAPLISGLRYNTTMIVSNRIYMIDYNLVAERSRSHREHLHLQLHFGPSAPLRRLSKRAQEI